MPIIDSTYFKGAILVPGKETPNTGVLESLNRYISQYETEYLQKVLGYQLWKNFMAGLNASTIAQKWIDLLSGAEFTNPYTNKLDYWPGLASTGSYSIPGQANEIVWTVGQALSPVAGGTTFTDARLLNRTYWVEKRGLGYLIRDTDYSVSGTTYTALTAGYTFTNEEVYVIHLTGYVQSSSTALNLSPIAYYIYWYYRKDFAVPITGAGSDVVAEAENSRVISPAKKMSYAWNTMVSLNQKLWMFLFVNMVDYSLEATDFFTPIGDYYLSHCSRSDVASFQNTFGI